MLIKNANVFRNDERRFENCDVRIIDGFITEIGIIDDADDEVYDAKGKRITSGLIDVHTHGIAGKDFLDADDEYMHKMAVAYASRGIVAVMPTVASAPISQMLDTVEKINHVSPSSNEARFCGAHIEGRYLNPQKSGAHAPSMLAPLNASELDARALSECRALHISAAYELDEDGSFAEKAKRIGATLGLGHTAATYEQAVKAEKRGVSAYTHLFNAMPPLEHRNGGAVCAALTGKCFAELICDGIHVSPEMVRLAYGMLGADRLVLISDSMEATGCVDGDYAIAGTPVTVKNGIARTPTGALAGSTLTLDVAVDNLMKFCDIPLEQAISCATENPAKEMGIYDVCGSVDVGKCADLIVLCNEIGFKISKVMINGRFI